MTMKTCTRPTRRLPWLQWPRLTKPRSHRETTAFPFPTGTTGWIAFNATTLLYSFAIIGMYIVLTMIGPMRTALTMNLEPVTSMMFGVFLLGQPMTLLQVFGGALVIAGVLLIRLVMPPRPQGESDHE